MLSDGACRTLGGHMLEKSENTSKTDDNSRLATNDASTDENVRTNKKVVAMS